MCFLVTFLQITVEDEDEDQQGQQNPQPSDVINVENDDQQTPLHVAAKSGSVKCVKFLIMVSANVGARDKDFKTPLHLAAEEGHLKCVEELARVSDVNAKDYNLNTPLHLAAKNNVSTFLFMLNHQKVDTSLNNRNFKTGKELGMEYFLFRTKSEKTSFIKNWEQSKDDKMQEMSTGDQMVHLLKLAGIKVRKGMETKGDENCFYRAVADQSSMSWTHSMLRETVVEHVEKEFNTPPNLRSETMNILVGCYEYENGDNSFREMIEEQKENTIWANETFIAYTANLLGIAIRVFEIEEGGLVREELFPSKLMTESEDDKTSQICIAHYDNHFQSVLI